MPDICPPGECLKEQLMEVFAEHRREVLSLREHLDERARELQRDWDAGVRGLRRDLDLMVVSTKIDPDALEQLLDQREEIAALKREVETLRREVEAMRGVKNGAIRGNGAN